ncbi:circumsporozoite protein [Beauveria brongniartii RCEF 3172]|uniref:Circumsporozoite protein n=1 Tax=Beauveria brongniartii RCEF 3172 TaxID=1081107 RepID=A0A162M1S0_9HYPO|nr:circumsporozoite protein [Beauveria brongniartii RCEF 3172]
MFGDTESQNKVARKWVVGQWQRWGIWNRDWPEDGPGSQERWGNGLPACLLAMELAWEIEHVVTIRQPVDVSKICDTKAPQSPGSPPLNWSWDLVATLAAERLLNRHREDGFPSSKIELPSVVFHQDLKSLSVNLPEPVQKLVATVEKWDDLSLPPGTQTERRDIFGDPIGMYTKASTLEADGARDSDNEDGARDSDNEDGARDSDNEDGARDSDNEDGARDSDNEDGARDSDNEDGARDSDNEDGARDSDNEDGARDSDNEDGARDSDNEDGARDSDNEDGARDSDNEDGARDSDNEDGARDSDNEDGARDSDNEDGARDSDNEDGARDSDNEDGARDSDNEDGARDSDNEDGARDSDNEDGARDSDNEDGAPDSDNEDGAPDSDSEYGKGLFGISKREASTLEAGGARNSGYGTVRNCDNREDLQRSFGIRHREASTLEADGARDSDNVYRRGRYIMTPLEYGRARDPAYKTVRKCANREDLRRFLGISDEQARILEANGACNSDYETDELFSAYQVHLRLVSRATLVTSKDEA